MALSRTKFELILLLTLVCWIASSLSLVEAGYRGPFEGRVVDKDTLQPIQGAVVFVEWKKEKLTPVHPVQEYYDAAEVLTDEKGEFYIPKKWSLNPWTNLMAYADVIIFKAEYGSVTIAHWPGLEELAERMKERGPELRKKMGPNYYFDIQFEERSFRRDLPVFLLKKLTTEKERMRNIPSRGSGTVPRNKKQLLLKEVNKERKLFGYGEVTD